MSKRQRWEVSARPMKIKNVPKMVMIRYRLKINEQYSAGITVWIPKTPMSNYRPTVNLVITHNGEKVRLCYQDVVSMVNSLKGLIDWVDEKFVMLHDKHTEALEGFLQYHEKEKLPSLRYRYTVNTSIHDESDTEVNIGVNRQTGEILGNTSVKHSGKPQNGISRRDSSRRKRKGK